MNGAKRVFICGIDGYLGWTLAMHLATSGYQVAGLDNFSRRAMVKEVGGNSLTPITSMAGRIGMQGHSEKLGENPIQFFPVDMRDPKLVDVLREFEPDAVVHLAEQPSAPYSMKSVRHAILTQRNNVEGTLNLLYAIKALEADGFTDVHLVKLGSMGEYGTPDADIPEGFVNVKDTWQVGGPDVSSNYTLPAPKYPGSWYHASKVHDTQNIMLANKLFDTTCTDIMQGIVYGIGRDISGMEDTWTRFDFDECFGTVINRFVVQTAMGKKMSIYGVGGQRRGFLPIADSIKCMRLLIDNPPNPGNYRVINQFAQVKSIIEVANSVQKAAMDLNLDTEYFDYLDNPRKEKSFHFYNPACEKLKEMGYVPDLDMDGHVREMLRITQFFLHRAYPHIHAMKTKTTWV